jgi:hypothetical protein
LTKNTADYLQTYSFGADITGCAANQIYSADNFVEMVPEQKTTFDLRPEDCRIPIFTWEKPTKGGRTFTICSRKAMCDLIRSTQRRFFYWQITQLDPCHFYLDFDLTYDEADMTVTGPRCVNAAIAEILVCMHVAIERLRDVLGNASFQNVEGYTISRLDANKDSKESTHLNIHFDGMHMFADYMQAQHFCALIMQITNEHYPDRKNNPVYFFHTKTKDYKSILDFGCFLSVNRNWRCIGCFKNKPDPSKIGGPLFPPCGNPNLICDDVNCRSHVRHEFTDAEFCENDPTFIPRNLVTGYPLPIHALRVPRYDMPDIGRSKPHNLSSPVGVNSNNTQSLITGFYATGDSNAMPAGDTMDILDESSNMAASDFYNERRHIMTLVAAMISRMRNTPVEFARFIKPEFARLSANQDKMCVYKYKTENKRCRRDQIPDVIEPHESNHIQFCVRINLPSPLVYIHCRDPECAKFIASLADKANRERFDYEVQMLDVNTPENAEMMNAYVELVKSYMLKCVYADSLLTKQ